MEVIRALDYVPSHSARSLASHRAFAIGLVLPYDRATTALNPYFLELMEAISLKAQEHGYGCLLVPQGASEALELLAEAISSHRVDGFIVVDPGLDSRLVDFLLAEQVPFVFLGTPELEGDFYVVDNDNEAIADQIIQHLVDLEYPRLGIISGDEALAVNGQYMAGCAHAIACNDGQLGLVRFATGDFSEESGYQAARRLVEELGTPAALFAFNDLMAVGAMRAIRDLGLRVPDDVAVVGSGDSQLASVSQPPLTSMRLHVDRMGAEASEKLIGLLAGEEPDERLTTIPAELVVRRSTERQTGSQRDTRGKEVASEIP
jgi:DNA-binding LacI/PurR family transcriptional regulator